ncbi:MAG: DNA polymerase III subunit alpha [Pseudomonadota bacterium]
MNDGFVHLHVHTEYSMVDSTVRIPQLIERCAEFGMPAVAIADQANVFGLVKLYRRALEHGVKPLIGVDLLFANPADRDRHDRVTLLCQSQTGYKNLTQLVTRSYREGLDRGIPLTSRDWLSRENCQGLMALSGGRDGDIGRHLILGHEEAAHDALERWLSVFDDRFFLELIRTGRQDEESCVQASVRLASDRSIPVVATNDVRFLNADGFFAHEARVCIHQGRGLSDADRPKEYSDQQYFKSTDEMSSLFSDLPEALQNTTEIARRCSLQLELGASFLPAFPVPDNLTTEEFLRAEANRGLRAFLATLHADGQNAAPEASAAYQSRLDTELNVICEMGFPGYFLIVADFIRWAKSESIPVGPGRGSGAGSLVAFVLGITALDPLEHDLLFERFLNPERVSMPDFDIDFCMEGRDRVIEYVASQYGRDRVSQIITYGSMAAKAVIRDAGRVLGHPYGFVDRIAKLVPFEIGITLEKALAQEPELADLYGSDEAVRGIIDLARSLEGLKRNAGKHAGGVVIAPEKLTDYTPLYCEDGGAQAVTQLDKDDVEAVGLVKFDFLGLRTLTIIDWAVRIVNEQQPDAPLDIDAIPMEDVKTFELLRSCETTAVFQLESRGMRDLVKRLRPDQFDDLVALVALFRPGPLQSGMVDDFIARKHDLNQSDIDYLHPDLRPVLETTYGVILYQEQVMQIAQVLAGYTLGGADLLRRAMGKKKPEEMAKQRAVFTEGATERGVAEATATRIFDLMEKFAGYGFNKSHSAAYALLSYQTAYLKAHYPSAFLSAVMSAELDNTDRLVVIKDDCRRQQLTLEAPDINRSTYYFNVAGERSIRYGLGALKGVGRAAVEAVIAEREANGAFVSLSSFCSRVDLEKVNRRAIEAMIKGGAFDSLGQSRRGQLQALPGALQRAEQEARAAEAGQNDLFGIDETPVVESVEEVAVLEWNDSELLANEKDALGLYLSGHPFDAVRSDAQHFVEAPLGTIAAEPAPQSNGGERSFNTPRRDVRVAGLIVDIRKRGNRVSVVLDDDTGRLEISLFSEAFDEYRHLLSKDEIVVVAGGLRYDDFIGGWQVTAKQLWSIDRLIEQRAERIILSIAPNGRGPQLLTALHDLLLPYREGQCDVAVQYTGQAASAHLLLGPEWTVRPSRELRDKLSELLGSDSVRLRYTPTRELM